jgi:hypothetical protein
MRKRDERERFARAVDRERSLPEADEEFAAELAVVAALREIGTNTATDDAARARIADRIGGRALPRPRAPLPASRPRRRLRPAQVLAGAAALLVAAGGLTVSASRDALPGDALYDVKRAGEEFDISLTFDREAEAFQRLDLAATRLTELGELAADDAGRHRYTAAMRRFHADATTGTALLVEAATSSGGGQLVALRSWADEQSRRLGALRPEVGGVAESGLDLLSRIGARADALRDRMSCYLITSGNSDELGPLPAAGACSDAPNTIEPPTATQVQVPPTGLPSTVVGGPPLDPPPSTAAAQPEPVTEQLTQLTRPAPEPWSSVPPVAEPTPLPPIGTPEPAVPPETSELIGTTTLPRLPLSPPVTIG